MNLFKSKDQPQTLSAQTQATTPTPVIQREIMSTKHTLISAGMEIKGVFTGRGDLQVDGVIEGNINIEGAVTVSDGAQITGDIVANTITIAGNVKGNITSKKLEITATGKVWGDLQVERLLQHEGGFHSGHSDMQTTRDTSKSESLNESSAETESESS
jgi:cytoskeletal protein CcmA (bactofilin family)